RCGWGRRVSSRRHSRSALRRFGRRSGCATCSSATGASRRHSGTASTRHDFTVNLLCCADMARPRRPRGLIRMDTMGGNFGSLAESDSYDPAEDEPVRETPPAGIGQDERRMQVRAYNHWAGLLGDRNFPAIEDLEPENLPDFGPYSVLLDFSSGIENPG